MTARELAGRLGLHRAGHEWRGRCPSCGYAETFALTEKQGRALAWCASCQDQDAVVRVLRGAGAVPPRPAAEVPGRNDEAATAERQARALALWNGSEPARGTPADRYLIARGLPGLAASAALRFRADTPHPAGGRLPAMIALVSAPDGAPVAIHRTYLRRDGGGKADVEPPRATLGPIMGGAVRLDPAAAELAIGEGIESSASAGRLLGLPAWAAISAGNLARGMVLPPEVRSIVIAVDADPAGERAAQEATGDGNAKAAGCEWRGRIATAPIWPMYSRRPPMADGFRLGDASPEPLADVVTRLAALPPLEYDLGRMAEAERLGVRVGTLDAEVVRARGASGDGADARTPGRALRLEPPERWLDAVDGAALLDALATFLARHVFLPSGAADALACWTMHSYCFERFRHSPRAAFTSPEKRCGKTTALDALGLLACKPLPTANVTAAALFRAIEAAAPTLLIDEADTFLAASEDLRGVLNAGHKLGGQVIRCVGDDAEPRAFGVFAPAAIAAIGRLPGTIEDRSIIVRMQRATRAERPAPLDPPAAAEAARLSRMCARWAADHAERLAGAEPSLPAALFNRSADNWRPLFAIAEAAGGDWPARLTAASAALAPDDDDAEGRGVRLLADIRDIFDARRTGRLPSAELCAALVAIEAAPWGELNHGHPITPHRLARLLGRFGIRPALKRDGNDVFRGYEHKAFGEAWSRYLAPAGGPPNEALQRYNPRESAIFRESEPSQAESGVTLPNSRNPASEAGCNGVTVQNPIPGADGMYEAPL